MEGGRERERGGGEEGREGGREKEGLECMYVRQKKGEREAIPVNSYLMPNSKEATMSLV